MGSKRKLGHLDIDRSNNNREDRNRRYRYQAKVTLSAFTETGQAELSIEVPKQRSYSGRRPVIPSSLADTPCATLGVWGVLNGLNTTLGTSRTSCELHTILKDLIERNYDFGSAFALLRPVWNTHNPSNELRRREGEDGKRRRKALEGNRIVDPNLTPRRVWDLCSNRVVPSWITEIMPTPISHAWVDEKDCVDVRTPINGKEWPVPIPKDTDLNLIRIEMLNMGVEYVWLDVLCLRQKEEGGLREDLRMEEWRLDVPTIGGVYSGRRTVVIYLSGLGRSLRLKDGDLDSDRSWFRRAWTLQEVGWKRTIAGDTPDGPIHARWIYYRKYETALLTRFHKDLHSLESRPNYIFATLADMQKRVSTNPVDRVAGLAFPLRPSMIPAYHESETLEDAWTALVNTMAPRMRAAFLLVYPGVGLGCKKWRPTWDQVMMEPLPKDVDLLTDVRHVDETDEDWFYGDYIEKGDVWVFDAGSAEGRDRCGELVIEGAHGIAHTFSIRVTHQFTIPGDTYTLLGDSLSHRFWAVGRRLPDQRFEKVSVIVMDRLEVYRLRDLGLVARSRNVLV
ncbi:hypothetical protein EDD85DRAFT_368819 [Armillaria nabsnona]|nr:hypothetical protein EDD85DRAFT_368819 [Armillaria nabsnona]